jgi:hypothetical protein
VVGVQCGGALLGRFGLYLHQGVQYSHAGSYLSKRCTHILLEARQDQTAVELSRRRGLQPAGSMKYQYRNQALSAVTRVFVLTFFNHLFLDRWFVADISATGNAGPWGTDPEPVAFLAVERPPGDPGGNPEPT